MCLMHSEAKQTEMSEFGAEKGVLLGQARRTAGSCPPNLEVPEGFQQSFFFFFFLKEIYLFIYFCLCWVFVSVRAFSSCGKRGPLFIAARGPLTIAASCCGAQAPDAQAQ